MVWLFHVSIIFGFEGKEEAALSLKEMGAAGTEEEEMFVKLIAEQTQRKTTDLGYRVIDQPYIEGRFHHIGFNIQKDSTSICIECHGNVPHDKSKEIRSFLNMHTFYTACETCHSLPEKSAANWDFRWYNKDNGKIVENPQALAKIANMNTSKKEKREYPIYGNYGAKIAPTYNDAGNNKLLHAKKEMAFAKRYQTEQQLLTPVKKSQMKKIIHRKVSKKSVQCKQCHQEEKPYIPFAKLGYPPRRVKELRNVAAVGMIRKYEMFYMPNFLNPGGVKE